MSEVPTNAPSAAGFPGVRRKWAEFRASLLNFSQLPQIRRSQLLFRGQGDARWRLTSTLDRVKSFKSDDDRREYVVALLDEFRREAALLRTSNELLLESEALELLARHQGLQSPLLDWTENPYVASYFAYFSSQPGADSRVWVLDRAELASVGSPPAAVDLIDDRTLLRFNRRALQQRSVFVRVNSVRAPLETLISSALFAFDLAAEDRRQALGDLDVMNINGTTLFDDLDGVARTVHARLLQ